MEPRWTSLFFVMVFLNGACCSPVPAAESIQQNQQGTGQRYFSLARKGLNGSSHISLHSTWGNRTLKSFEDQCRTSSMQNSRQTALVVKQEHSVLNDKPVTRLKKRPERGTKSSGKQEKHGLKNTKETRTSTNLTLAGSLEEGGVKHSSKNAPKEDAMAALSLQAKKGQSPNKVDDDEKQQIPSRHPLKQVKQKRKDNYRPQIIMNIDQRRDDGHDRPKHLQGSEPYGHGPASHTQSHIPHDHGRGIHSAGHEHRGPELTQGHRHDASPRHEARNHSKDHHTTSHHGHHHLGSHGKEHHRHVHHHHHGHAHHESGHDFDSHNANAPHHHHGRDGQSHHHGQHNGQCGHGPHRDGHHAPGHHPSEHNVHGQSHHHGQHGHGPHRDGHHAPGHHPSEHNVHGQSHHHGQHGHGHHRDGHHASGHHPSEHNVHGLSHHHGQHGHGHHRDGHHASGHHPSEHNVHGQSHHHGQHGHGPHRDGHHSSGYHPSEHYAHGQSHHHGQHAGQHGHGHLHHDDHLHGGTHNRRNLPARYHSGSSRHRSLYGDSSRHCNSHRRLFYTDCCSECSCEGNIAFENTYKLEPECEFNPLQIRGFIRTALEKNLKDKEYDPIVMHTGAREISESIKKTVKTATDLSRFKLVCVVLIGQGKSQSVHVASRCLWDKRCDNFATATVRFGDFFATGMVFATYYE